MPFEIEIATEDNHIFVMRIDSVLEAPVKGKPIVCKAIIEGRECGKHTKVRRVGIPSRVRDEGEIPHSDNQENLFKE